MSRSGYSDDCEHLGLYRAAVERSIKGKRGQKFLSELAAAMDAMPEKKLITDELITPQGDVCTLGVVCKARGTDISRVDLEDTERVGKLLGISRSMVAEIEFENDEYMMWNYANGRVQETPEGRWIRMRKWVEEQLKP